MATIALALARFWYAVRACPYGAIRPTRRTGICPCVYRRLVRGLA